MSYLTSPENEDKNLDKALKGAVGSSPLIKEQEKLHGGNDKRDIFCGIYDLVHAASELYCDEDMTWDEMVSQLSKDILKLKGKEQDLMDAHEKDETPEDELAEGDEPQ